MENKMQNMLEKIWKEAERLTLEEQLELMEKLVHKLRKKKIIKSDSLDWSEIYGLGKGLWEGEDAQEYVNRLREDR